MRVKYSIRVPFLIFFFGLLSLMPMQVEQQIAKLRTIAQTMLYYSMMCVWGVSLIHMFISFAKILP